jgi:hydroxyacylglutathione hydrolase
MKTLDVELIPAFSDNYIYLIHQRESERVGVVDPGDAQPVIDVLEARGWSLDTILLTHHHGDHIGGVGELKRRHRAVVIGPASEARRIPDLDRGLKEGDRFEFGHEMVEVFETPGHTTGHIAFWFPDSRALFAGDTLFAMGCGRLFEGSPGQMWQSLAKLRGLPDDARLYCGHEYTQKNAHFALTVDPDNADLQARVRQVDEARARGEPTLPASLGAEKRTNPFLRVDIPELQAGAGMAGRDPVEVFAAIRERRNTF